MFGNLDMWKILVIVLVGLFIFGPDKLPNAISDGIKMLRQLRAMARNATSDLSRELGTEITLEDLNPKAFVRKHVLSDDDESFLRRQFDDVTRDIRSAVDEPARDTRDALDPKAPLGGGKAPSVAAAEAVANAPRRPRFDADAT